MRTWTMTPNNPSKPEADARAGSGTRAQRKRPISFAVSLPDVQLCVEDIWPDGNAPTNPTAEDVVKVMEQHAGGVSWVLMDWNLAPELEVFGNHDASRAVFR